jgi:hypothetical protein
MIYSYKYKKHKIEKFHEGMQSFYQYLFDNEPAAYDRTLMFPADFAPIIEASETKFEEHLKELVTSYAKLDKPKKRKVRLAFKNNNQVEKLCDKKLTPVKYSDFPGKFAATLKTLDKKLWTGFPHNLKGKSKCGSVKQHFDMFTDEDFQTALICPFCGITSLEPSGGEYRDAYDHYLPKSKYPFTSINFKNLIPICDKCNKGGRKGDKDILHRKKTRRTVFYPFDTSIKPSKLSMNIIPNQSFNPITKSTRLKNIRWVFSVEISGKRDPRVQTWEEIFGIQRRYKDNMKVQETMWFNWVKERYKESLKNGVSFPKFKKDRLKELNREIAQVSLGMLKYTYVKFLFSQKNIKQKLELLVKVK